MEVLTLDPAVIFVPERQRKDYGDLDEMVESLKSAGQIHPILITNLEERHKGLTAGCIYQLVAGGRRLASCKKAGLKIDATVRENCTTIELKELELFENLYRKDLTWVERDNAIAELDALKKAQMGERGAGHDKGVKGWSLQDTATTIGETKSVVHDAVKMAAAIKVLPELATCKSHNEAKKKLDKMTEKLFIAELADRRKKVAAGHSVVANENFIVGDAFEGMKKIPNESVDFINLDTPYGIDLTSQKKIQSGVRTDDDYQEWDKTQFLNLVSDAGKVSKIWFEEGNIKFLNFHFEGMAWDTMVEAFRILKPNSWMLFWFGQEWQSLIKAALETCGFKLDKIPAAWYGGAGAAQTIAVEINLGRCYEQFFVCRKGDPILVKRGRPNVFPFDKVPAQRKIHPTEKPLGLMVELYETFILPGSICCSPFIGSGNDGRAAYIHGDHWFGFDLNEDVKNKFLLRVEEDIAGGLYGNNTDSGNK